MGHNDPSGRVASRTSLAANPPISAGLRAFSLIFSITQRDAF
jgi:hypothetical protein